MNLKPVKTIKLLAPLMLLMLATENVLTTQPPPPRPALPNPVLVFTGQELFTEGKKQFVRYNYTVDNSASYPDELFAAAPDLPPCGKNTKSSRTWVDIYDQSGKRLYGFCALGKNKDLNKIWFALEQGAIPPSWVYIEMNDRKTNTKYKSNLAETAL
ncbi:MAG: hypothetical protein M3362_05415 [Acidobacteriota bacterium]|nr:hypothetical protein [Acidobacteriota bacterium]